MLSAIYTPFIRAGKPELSSAASILEDNACRTLSGPAWEKVLVLKFLLAAAEAAVRPQTAGDLPKTNAELARQMSDYFQMHESAFDAEDPAKPFLQLKAAGKAKSFATSAALPGKLTGNNAVVQTRSIADEGTDAEKILALLANCTMPFSGKKHDSCWIGAARDEKKSGFVSAMLGMNGLCHAFILGKTVLDTVRLNLLTEDDLAADGRFPCGIGVPPWEKMPTAEDGKDAEQLRRSLMGRLMPLCRFSLLEKGELHSTLGILPVPISENGMSDPSVFVFPNSKSALGWSTANMARWSPWEVIGIALTGRSSRMKSESVSIKPPLQIAACLQRAVGDPGFAGLWAGGLEVKWSTGEQFLASGQGCREAEVRFEGAAGLQAAQRRMQMLIDLARRTTGKFYVASQVLPNPDAVQMKAGRAVSRLFDAYLRPCLEGTDEGSAASFRALADDILALYSRYIVHKTSSGRILRRVAEERPNVKSWIKEKFYEA